MVDILLILVINFFSAYMAVQYYRVLKKEALERAEREILPGRQLKRERLLRLTCFAVLGIILNFCCFYLNKEGNEIIEIICAFCVAVILLCETLAAVQKENAWKEYGRRRELMIQRQLQYYSRQYEALSHFNESMRRERHERKNRNLALLAMARSKDIKGITEALTEEQESLCRKDTLCITGNMALDAVLGYELSLAREKQIRTECSVSVPNDMDVSASVLCGILGNALDNAIEAAGLLEPEHRRLSVYMKVDKKNLFIEIRNMYNGKLIVENGRIFSGKPDPQNHGQGLRIIRELAGQAGGTVETYWDEREFVLRIILFHVL